MKKTENSGGNAGKTKRIGKKVGNIVVIMIAASIFCVVALCTWMFHSLVMETLESECVAFILEFKLFLGGCTCATCQEPKLCS